MECKISSSFTEFYKVYPVFWFFLTSIFWGPTFLDFSNPFLFSLSLIFIQAITFDFWRMKKVELTEIGFIITNRFFFKEECVFVPFEKVEVVRNKFRWMGNYKRVSVKFIEPIKFGKEISFLCNRSKITAQVEMVEELNRSVRQSKISELLKRKFY